MQNIRTVESPEDLLTRSYYAAQHSGIFEKLSTIYLLYGTGGKHETYRLVHGDLCLYLDGDDGSLTVYYGSDMVCSTLAGGELFIYGAWVIYIEELYQAITVKTGT